MPWFTSIWRPRKPKSVRFYQGYRALGGLQCMLLVALFCCLKWNRIMKFHRKSLPNLTSMLNLVQDCFALNIQMKRQLQKGGLGDTASPKTLMFRPSILACCWSLFPWWLDSIIIPELWYEWLCTRKLKQCNLYQYTQKRERVERSGGTCWSLHRCFARWIGNSIIVGHLSHQL